MADVLDRDQVLHVARLARLELAPDEVKRMAAELSNVSVEASLDEKFRKLEQEQGPQVDDALAALKSKMGLPAAQGQKVEIPAGVAATTQRDPVRR